MPVFTRTNGGVAPGEFIGRDIKFVKCNSSGIHTNAINVDSDHEIATRILSQYATITLVGTPASNNAIWAVEGLPTDVAGTAIVSQLNTEGNAALASTATVWTVYNGISGDTFA